MELKTVIFFFISVCLLSTLACSFAATSGEHADITRLEDMDKYPDQEWRRRQGGPGSQPPRCRAKCGGCTPCRPVHVAIPPGTPVTAEYYPEAWRCKCGNRIYKP